jgi:uncharacterized membrane protein
MRKVVIIALLGFVGLVVLAQSGVFEALIFFLLMGIVPGTNFTVPAGVMLMIIVSVLWLVIFRFVAIEAFSVHAARRAAKLRVQHKKRVPKRRFSQI